MITETLSRELDAMVEEQPAPPPDRLVTGALTRARRIRARRRACVTGVAVAGVVAVALTLPGAGTRSTPGPTATQGPTPSGSPTGPATRTSEPTALPRLRLVDCEGKVSAFCWLGPTRIVVDGATYVSTGSRSLPLRGGANRELSMVTGQGQPKPKDLRVLVGLAGPRSARLPDVVAFVDGERVMTVSGGGPRLLDVRRGRHEVRLELAGTATPRTHLVIAEYDRRQ
jgi:hypothetical protein